MYGDNYGYRSGLNASMVATCTPRCAGSSLRVELPGNALIVDIGSNDSTTLQAYPAAGCTLVGIDPTGDKFRELLSAAHPAHPRFLLRATCQQALPGAARRAVITSFSMFYDLEEPLKFMQRGRTRSSTTTASGCSNRATCRPCSQRNSYDTVCHEHLEYYALKQIKWMADKVGLKIVDVEFNDINGGSFSVMVAKQGRATGDSLPPWRDARRRARS